MARYYVQYFTYDGEKRSTIVECDNPPTLEYMCELEAQSFSDTIQSLKSVEKLDDTQKE